MRIILILLLKTLDKTAFYIKNKMLAFLNSLFFAYLKALGMRLSTDVAKNQRLQND